MLPSLESFWFPQLKLTSSSFKRIQLSLSPQLWGIYFFPCDENLCTGRSLTHSYIPPEGWAQCMRQLLKKYLLNDCMNLFTHCSQWSSQNRNLITIFSTLPNLPWFWKVKIRPDSLTHPTRLFKSGITTSSVSSHNRLSCLHSLGPSQRSVFFLKRTLCPPFPGPCACCSLSSWPCKGLFIQRCYTDSSLLQGRLLSCHKLSPES